MMLCNNETPNEFRALQTIRRGRFGVSRFRPGFTLVEILVSLVLIAILSGMVTVAVRSTQQSARRAATEGLIHRIDSVIRTKWDEYRYRPLSVQMDATAILQPNQAPPQFKPEEVGRLRLMMLRDLMRMELPERRSDLSDPTRVVGSASILFDSLGNRIDPPNVEAVGVLWQTPSQLLNYRAKATVGWTPQHESAECLYLILSSTTVNGISALDVIAPAQIQDTDGDGMPEIVDAWGNPISFIRWPSGSNHPVIASSGEDEFDLLGSDWGMLRDNVETPYSLTPQIVSPGPDGELGLVTTAVPATPYSQMTWPANQTEAGTALTNPYVFIDPYLRVLTGGINTSGGLPTPNRTLRPGAFIAGGQDLAADNISSFDL